jgi:hypothetical protein
LLRFNFHEHCPSGSENEFVDIDSFSDAAPEVQKEAVSAAAAAETPAAAIDTTVSQPIRPQDEASPEFTKELELTIHRGEDPVQDAPLLEIREDIPEGQAPSPYLDAFNKSFGTSYRGELLCVGCKVASIGDGTSRILTLWKSPTLADETGEGASEQTSLLPRETVRDFGKKPCTSSKRTSTSLEQALFAKDKKRCTTFYNSFRFRSLDFLFMTSFCNFPEFEDLLRSFSASELAVQRRDYAAKASISGRIACERLIEQEMKNKKLVEDRKKLSHDLKLSRAANSYLEKKVSELAVALKKCQDEKRSLKRLLRIREEILKSFRKHTTRTCD